MERTEQEARHLRDMALARAVRVALPGSSSPEDIVKAADAFLEFLQGPPHPTIWFMGRTPEEVVSLLGAWLADRPESAKSVAYHILNEWVKDAATESADGPG